MSHRASLILLLLGVIVALRLMLSGKLSNAMSALFGASGTAAAAGTGGGASTGGGSAPKDATATSGASFFGLSNISSVLHPTQYLGADQGLFPGVAGEVNYLGVAPQTPLTLPAGSWNLVSETGPAAGAPGSSLAHDVGGVETWLNAATGAEFSFLHLLGLYNGPQTGVQGGTEVGLSGYPLGPLAGIGGSYGPSNAHVAVVYNAQAAKDYSL